MNQYDLTHDLKINIGYRDLYFMVQWFCLISWRLWCMYIILSKYESVQPGIWPQNKCRSLWPYFMVHWLCLIQWRLFDIWTSLFGIMNQYYPTHHLKIDVGHCDLYFMVQWFYVISWRIFDVWTSSLGIMGQYDRTFDLKINVSHCDLYFMVHWFCLISERLIDGWES